MRFKIKIFCLQIFTFGLVIAEEKTQNVYNYESASIPMSSLYNEYRLNEIAKTATASNIDPKFQTLNEIFPDSQVYYYRMPVVTPYVYVADFGGYVDSSQPFLPFAPSSSLPIQLPLSFLANGKPTSIHAYSPLDLHQINNKKPEKKPSENQNSNIFNLNKGPYFLNGKATDVYLLQDTFNAFNANPLNTFYP